MRIKKNLAYVCAKIAQISWRVCFWWFVLMCVLAFLGIGDLIPEVYKQVYFFIVIFGSAGIVSSMLVLIPYLLQEKRSKGGE